uniref:Integrase catalytic domain-containing protein n=2 Tax=Meloidogyne TaxID=189290 RepID=A0A6V7W8D9_MELEN|nr:unnamed protein product [Meloidogyne enterolobii]
MSAHFRGQITLLNEEAAELLNSRKDFLLPPKVGGQSDKEYKRIIETILHNLDAEYEEISEVLNQLADNEAKWSALRTNMTGNERIQDNTEYDAFIVAVPFVKTLSDLRRYLRNIRSQRRLLEAAIPVIENINVPIASSLIHLPKTQLPTFSGDCVAFLSFWNTFKAGVHDLPISDSIKFTYLKQCLSGSPLTLISSLPVTDESYESALELLRKNYDNPNEVARSLHNSLRKLPQVRAGENFCTDLRLLLDKIEGICVQMSQRNQSFNTTSFQMEIEERLPRFVLDEIFKAKDNDPEWDSLKLKEHLHHILKRKEQIESLTLSSHNTPKQIRTSQLQTPSSQNNKPPPILSFHTQGENQNKNNTRGNNKKPKWPCLFCENPSHFSANCETYLSIKQRKDKLRALKRCFSCLRPNHLANQCTKPSQCSNCQGKHPRALCPTLQNRSSYYTSNLPPNIQEGGPRQTQASNLNNQHVQAVSIPHPIPMPLSQIVQTTASAVPDTPPYQANLASVSTESINKKLILLKCVRVMLFNPNNPLQEREVILLMDDASTNSYITLNEAKNLKLNLTPRTIKLGVFNSPSCKVVQAYTTQFGIRLANGRSIIITANAAEHLTQNTNYVPFTPQLLSYPELISNNKIVQPSVLLGSDYYYEVEPTPLLRLPSGHHLIHTLFGPIVAGKGFIPRNTNQPNQINCAIQPQLEAPSNEFFSLESIGIKDLPRSEDQDVLKKFNKEIKMIDGRYQVKLPFKTPPEAIQIPSNFGLCWGRLRSVHNSLMKNKEFLIKYDNIIKEQLELGIIEIVKNPDNYSPPLHYIPHHALIKASNGKIRIVYDGSAKVGRELSLNECLYPGPVILPDLVGLLLRFRIPKIAIISDIAKAFLQVSVHPDHRDCTRFLWLKNIELPPSTSNVEIYRFCRVSFGLAPSPFLLAATVQHHLSLFPSPLSSEISTNIYVDNVFLSAETPKEGKEKSNNTIELFNKANMKLQEFVSNSSESIAHLPEKIKLIGNKQKFLGLDWHTEEDVLLIRAHALPSLENTISKRTILTFMASHFDPLGLISPLILPIKIFLQSLWNEKVDWDENLNEKTINEWKLLTQNWDANSCFSIPRYPSRLPTTGRKYQLHCFADASSMAMCAAVYLRISKDCSPISDVCLIFSKTKVKPINKNKLLSIPRLELIAALMGSRALKFTSSELSCINLDKSIYLWSDSSAVLSWLNSKTLIKDIFVQNRVSEIRKLKNLIVNHLPGIDNPSDIGTRGVSSIRELKNLPIWTKGPDWLSLPQPNWPTSNLIKQFSSNDYVLKSEKSVETPIFTFNTQINAPENIIESVRFSRLPKLLRIFSYTLRFINHTKKRARYPSLKINSKEIKISLKILIKLEQAVYPPSGQENEYLGIYTDPEEILRCKGRLGKSNLTLETKEPIFLPSRSYLTCLIIYETHLLNHHSSPLLTLSIIRKQFWIPSGRRVSEKAIHKCCLSCRRFTAKPFDLPPFPQFPTDRVEPSPPFTAVGLDFCGPLYIKTPFLVPNQRRNTKIETIKHWITVWVCLSTRAVALDLISDLTIQSFSLAFRRQTAKYGVIKNIYCDNAPTFISAKNFLSEQANLSPPNWNFRAPMAAWKSGHYERSMALIKYHLKRTLSGGAIPRSYLFHEVLTILLEIENIINSRPITFESANPLEPRALSPADIIKPYRNNSPIEITPSEKMDDPDYNQNIQSNSQSLITTWEKITSRAKNFWIRWKADYILSLRERYKKLQQSSQRWPTINELVIVHSDTLPRSNWSLAIILEINYTENHFPNTAKIKFLSGNITLRSVHHLYPLETTGELNVDKNQTEKVPLTSPRPNSSPNTLKLRNRIVNKNC